MIQSIFNQLLFLVKKFNNIVALRVMIKLQLNVYKQPYTDYCVMLKVFGCDHHN